MERIQYGITVRGDASPYEIANKFLYAQGYIGPAGHEIKYYKGEFYVYQGTHYRRIPRGDFELEILQFLQEQKKLQERARTHLAREVAHNLAAIVKVGDDVEMPAFLDKPHSKGTRFIAMKNGIFNLDKFMAGKNPLQPHTSKFFSTACLPFNYEPRASLRERPCK